jgi:hypothetical protein
MEGNAIEEVSADGKTLALIVRAQLNPAETTFITPPEYNMQVGFVVYPSGGVVEAHSHVPLERHLVGTSEVLLVRRGRCQMDVYDDEQALVSTYELGPGDVILMVAGGHGFRMLEDTTLLEVKQGPYTGLEEKIRFPG